jgi:ketosteroid isomerase-like protein
MSDLTTAVRDFFNRFQSANAEFDVAGIVALYADVFMFGDPSGARSVNREDFAKVLPGRNEFFKSKGLVSSKLVSLEASHLDSNYVLGKTVWKMHLETNGSEPREFSTSATYLLSAIGDSYRIVFQIDHEDLTKKIHELGLSAHGLV